MTVTTGPTFLENNTYEEKGDTLALDGEGSIAC